MFLPGLLVILPENNTRVDPTAAVERGPSTSLTLSIRGVAEAAIYCEQAGHLAALSPDCLSFHFSP